MDMEIKTDTHSPADQTNPPAPMAQAEAQAEVIDQATAQPLNSGDTPAEHKDGTDVKEGAKGVPTGHQPEISPAASNAPHAFSEAGAARPGDGDTQSVPGVALDQARLASPAVADAPAVQGVADFAGSVHEPDAPAGGSASAAVVPLARLQGVQRQLSLAQKDLMAARVEAIALRESLSAAEKRAAGEYAERLRTTHRDIVPQLIGGETIEQVDQSLANSKAAFSVAQQAYARLLPTPAFARVGAAAPQDADQGLTPLQLLRAGLSQTKNDINR
jgi:hypothetical protein